MTGMSSHARLTRRQRQALAFAVLVVMAGMAMGFLSSFTTLYDAAAAHRWTYPALLPASVDSGILAYVLLDHLAVTLGARSRWLHLVAWALAAFTVWANAVVSPSDGVVWRVIHAAMPALWVLGVEALRFTWRRLHEDPAAEADRIPAARWLAAPWPALKMWRRMHLHNITAYPYAVALADAELLARDIVRAEPGWGAAPASLRRQIRSWRFPGSVHDAIRFALENAAMPDTERSVSAFVTDALTRPDRHRATLSGKRRDIAREVSRSVHEDRHETVHETPSGDSTQAPSRDMHEAAPVTPARERPRKRTRPEPRKMSDDELMPFVRDVLVADPGASIASVRRATGTGPARAKQLLERGQDEERQHRVSLVK